MLHRNITPRAAFIIERLGRSVPSLAGNAEQHPPAQWGVCIVFSNFVTFFQWLAGPATTAAVHTATCVPTSTTRPVGMWKKSVASLADLAKPMNSRSCQRGMPDRAAGLSARRDRKNDVGLVSKCQPC